MKTACLIGTSDWATNRTMRFKRWHQSRNRESSDTKRLQYITCTKGKQTKSKQSKDSDQNLLIDRIGGVICSDLKGPITPSDREKNRYLIKFIDHKTNYCLIFLTKTKDEAAKKFMHFVGHFERRFDCRIQVL